MAIEHAFLLKGWLLSQSTPKEITEAIDALIVALRVPPPAAIPENFVPARNEPVVAHAAESPDITETTLIADIIAPKPRKPWSPEAKAAAAERMRAMQAKKKAERQGGTPAAAEPSPLFSEPELRITVPAPRRISTLKDADWPEIKQMLASGKTRRAIASDFDEESEDLDFFIESCQRREQREGNFAAPVAGA